jgi:hypothetical protein
MFHGKVKIGDSLGLYTLGSIDKEKNTLAGSQGTGDFIGKVNMPWRIYEIKAVCLSVSRPVWQRNSLALDRYPPLPFNIHRIKYLVFEGAFIGHTGILDKSVGKGRLTVVNVGNDAEIPNVAHKFKVKKAFRLHTRKAS